MTMPSMAKYVGYAGARTIGGRSASPRPRSSTAPDEAKWGDQIFAYNAHLWQMFGSDAPFDFFAWYEDPKLQGFKQNVEYQNEAWSKQKVAEGAPNALMKPEILLITEYLMQIMVHCGRLKAKIPVRKYLLAAVEA